MEIYVQEVLRLLSHWNIVRGLPSAGRVNEMPLVVWRLMILGCSLRVSGSTPRFSYFKYPLCPLIHRKKCGRQTVRERYWGCDEAQATASSKQEDKDSRLLAGTPAATLIHERDQQQNIAGGRERINKTQTRSCG